MKRSVPLARVEDLPPGSRTFVQSEGQDIAVFNVDGEIFAVDDTCPHAGSSLFGGRLQDKTIHCRAHGFNFELSTGRMRGFPEICIASFPISIENGMIFAEVES